MITSFEFHSRISEAALDIIRRAAKADELDIRPKVVAPGRNAQPPFKLRRALRGEEQYVQRLYELTNEVMEAYAAMRTVETYLARFAYSARRVSRSAYVKYHFTAFMNEMYILQQRMERFATRLGREFKNEPNTRQIDERIKDAEDDVRRLFEPAANLRGGHVHNTRYIDAEFAQLALWEMLGRLKPQQFRTHANACADAVRKSNLEFVSDINRHMAVRLDAFFSFFEGLVFTEDGAIRYPSNIRGRPN